VAERCDGEGEDVEARTEAMARMTARRRERERERERRCGMNLSSAQWAVKSWGCIESKLVFIQRESRENGVKINISTIVSRNQETQEQQKHNSRESALAKKMIVTARLRVEQKKK
jgi:hypothetical protein